MKHIGFIMDGNRRWAKKLKQLATFGHNQGGDTLERVLELVLQRGIPFVSMWALSKENILERATDELNYLYQLIREKIPKLVKKMIAKGIRFEIIGDIALIPEDIQKILSEAISMTKDGIVMTFVLAFGYSGQDEIVRGVKRCIKEGVDPDTLTEKSFLAYLDSGKYPPLDLIVRTGGRIRHSGFFLYQSAYAEYFFTETLWPDFAQKDMDAAMDFFDGTQRNFGK